MESPPLSSRCGDGADGSLPLAFSVLEVEALWHKKQSGVNLKPSGPAGGSCSVVLFVPFGSNRTSLAVKADLISRGYNYPKKKT